MYKLCLVKGADLHGMSI